MLSYNEEFISRRVCFAPTLVTVLESQNIVQHLQVRKFWLIAAGLADAHRDYCTAGRAIYRLL